MARIMKAARCPTEDLSLTNCAICHPNDFDLKQIKHISLRAGTSAIYIFTLKSHPSVTPGTIGFSLPQRKWATLSLNQEIEVAPHQFDSLNKCMSGIVVEAEFLQKKSTTTEPYDSDKMATEFLMQFNQQAFTVGQQLVFQFQELKMLSLTVKEITVLDTRGKGGEKQERTWVTMPNTVVTFEKAENSPLNLVGKSKTKQSFQSIINPDWDFTKMGVGGLDKEFNAIFRRAFSSRVFPPELTQQLGIKHCRGILLYGPPGTGKTLMARQIGQMLNAREPKIVNGPQILDKYVGESEANIRKLFAEAEEEEKRMGPNSGLHIIIFDEIDAICKARGSVSGSTAVHDTVVNQLLSKIDGVDQLNNILIIGMTNRKDMIDEALLRPGRLEVQMEISLPNEAGRVQILNIHTCKLRENKKLAPDVNIAELAALSKNFSGAEIEGLVRASTSTAMNRLIKASTKVEVDPDAPDKLQVTRADFMHALEYDIKPSFGASQEELERHCANGIINWGEPVQRVLADGDLVINETRNGERSQLTTILLSGPANSGKTALAVQIAKNSDFPFMKICTPQTMIGFTESAKCVQIKKIFDDAYKSSLSCIILDDIESLLDYVAIGPRFSNLVLQALRVLLKQLPPAGRRLMVIGTTRHKDMLEQMDLLSAFSSVCHVSNLTTGDHLLAALEDLQDFTQQELQQMARHTDGKRLWIGIKKLISLSGMAKQTDPKHRVIKFLSLMEEEGGLEMG